MNIKELLYTCKVVVFLFGFCFAHFHLTIEIPFFNRYSEHISIDPMYSINNNEQFNAILTCELRARIHQQQKQAIQKKNIIKYKRENRFLYRE